MRTKQIEVHKCHLMMKKTMFQNAKMLNNHTEGQRCHEKSVSKSHIA